MSQADKLYRNYFLEYASYVVRDRAIPDLVDGFKPVQRRIMHTLFEMDDGCPFPGIDIRGGASKAFPADGSYCKFHHRIRNVIADAGLQGYRYCCQKNVFCCP